MNSEACVWLVCSLSAAQALASTADFSPASAAGTRPFLPSCAQPCTPFSTSLLLVHAAGYTGCVHSTDLRLCGWGAQGSTTFAWAY